LYPKSCPTFFFPLLMGAKGLLRFLALEFFSFGLDRVYSFSVGDT